MRDNALRLLVFGAHPDDADLQAGGLAALYAKHGHMARLVSVTNGAAGHHEMGGIALAERRRAEAAASGRTLGVEYVVWDNPDGALVPSLPVRERVIREIRRFRPDLVLCPRLYDYHPDHRATAQLVQDAIYMVTVPNVVMDVPHLRKMPVVAYVMDGFEKPNPFDPDVVVDIGSVVERKLTAVGCHVSQFFEWLPYNRREEDALPQGEPARSEWLRAWLAPRFSRPAERFRAQLAARYGAERAAAIRYAEAFEGCEYGSPLDEPARERLFGFLD